MKSKEEITFDLLENTGLNWTVNKEQLQTADGKLTDSYGVFRSDNQEWMGTVSERYNFIQNFELAEMLVEAGNITELDFTTGGQLQKGKKIYIQADLPDATIGNDTLKRKLTALNSHDGRSAIGFGTTNTVVICSNTFHLALKDKGMSRFRHSTTAKERISALVQDIRAAVLGEETVVEQMMRMTDHKIQKEPFDRVMKVLFGDNHGKPIDEQHGKTKKNMNQFAEVLEKEVQSHGNTLWGLFNAVTYYTNHSKGEKNLDSLMAGTGYQTNAKSFEAILDWVENNTAHLVTI